MLDGPELRLLSTWCAANAMRWRPLTQDVDLAVRLEPREPSRGWQGMLLTVRDDFTLTTEVGEDLANASSLRALLDALEAGLAAPAVAACFATHAAVREPELQN